MKISAVVLTHNNQDTITNCLKSLKFAQEIIVVDNYSTDLTLSLVKKFTRYIFQHRLDSNWASQRNFALKKVKNNWVFFLDSDETVSLSLIEEIISLKDSLTNGYYITRQDFFLGRQIKFGEMGGTKLIRLAKKDTGLWHRPVHEVWKISPPIYKLKNPIIHQRNISLTDFFTRVNTYTNIDAPQLLKEGKSFSYLSLFSKPIGKFIYNYVFRLGFLDFYPGLISAYFMSLHSLITRVKLYELSNE